MTSSIVGAKEQKVRQRSYSTLTSFAIRRKLLQLFDYFGHFNITLITGYLAGITP